MSATPPTNGAAKRKALRNPTGAYRGGSAWFGFGSQVLDNAPLFTWLDVPRMLRDPRVRFIERMWRAPFQRVKWKVKAEDGRVERFVDATLRRFWRGSLPKLLSRYFRYGFAPGGAEYRPHKGAVRLDRVRSVEPGDAHPLVWASGPDAGRPAGFTLTDRGGPGSAAGETWVGTPHAFWFSGYGEYGPWYDAPPLSGLFEPWLEKRTRGGAVQTRRLGFRKYAFTGGVLYHPPGTSNMGTEESPREMDNQDVARSTLDYAESGSVFTFVNEVNAASPSLYAWDFKPAQSGQIDLTPTIEYVKQLDTEMLEGAGIPAEAFEAAEVGSGWSGRMVPMLGFLGGVDELAGMLVESADAGWLSHLVGLNYGRAWYEVEPLSLAEEVQRQAQEGKGGGPDDPLKGMFGGQPRPDSPRPESVSMSWDESRVRRDRGKFSSQGGAGAADPEPDAPEPHEDAKARRIIRALKALPRRAVAKAKAKVADAYQKLEQRYGPGYARVIVGAGVASLPVPIPGAAVAFAAPVLAVAELHRQLAKWGTPPPDQIDHENVVKPAARWFLSRVMGRVRGALHLSATPEPDVGRKLMNYRKRDLVRLVALAMLKRQEEATAGGDPASAAEDIEKLALIAKSPTGMQEATESQELSWLAYELSWERYEGPRGGKGWKNTETGRVWYTSKGKPGEAREKREASAARAKELVLKVHRGGLSADELMELGTHIPALTVARLRRTREILGAGFANARQRDGMVSALLAHVRGAATEKRIDELPETDKAAVAGELPTPGDRTPDDEVNAEAFDRADEHRQRMAQWAADKPHSLAAQEALDRAESRVESLKPAAPTPTVTGGEKREAEPPPAAEPEPAPAEAAEPPAPAAAVEPKPPVEAAPVEPPAPARRLTVAEANAADNFDAHEVTRDDYPAAVGRKTHHVGPKDKPGTVFPGDAIRVASRGKKPWVARLGDADKKYGRQREFLNGKESRSGMRKQIVTHEFVPDEPGEYEVAGNEFGDFRHTFTVTDPAVLHRRRVEEAIKSGKPVHPEVLADYPDLAAKHAPPPAPEPAAPKTPAAGVVRDAIAAAVRGGTFRGRSLGGNESHRVPMSHLRAALAAAGVTDRAAQDDAILDATFRDPEAKTRSRLDASPYHVDQQEEADREGPHRLRGVGNTSFAAVDIPAEHAGHWSGEPAPPPAPPPRRTRAAKPKAAQPAGGFGSAGAGHPLAGLGRDAQFARLGELAGQLDPPLGGDAVADPAGLRAAGPPPGLDVGAFAADVHRAVARHMAEANAPNAPVEAVYAAAGKAHGLSKHDFARALVALEDADAVGPGGGRGVDALSVTPGADPELAYPSPKNRIVVSQVRLPGGLRTSPAEQARLAAEPLQGRPPAPPPRRTRSARAKKPPKAAPAAPEPPKSAANSGNSPPTTVDKPTSVGNNTPAEPPKSGGGATGGGKMEATLAPIKATSDKQREYAEKVRGKFLAQIQRLVDRFESRASGMEKENPERAASVRQEAVYWRQWHEAVSGVADARKILDVQHLDFGNLSGVTSDIYAKKLGVSEPKKGGAA